MSWTTDPRDLLPVIGVVLLLMCGAYIYWLYTD